MCYVEFGDEDAMKSGLAKQGEVSHQLIVVLSTRDANSLCFAQTLNDSIPELKQATDKESRASETGPRGSFSARGGRGRGGFAARGFASAGLTRGGPPGRLNGDAPPSEAPRPSEGS